MEIVFAKLPGNRHAILVRDRSGPDVRRGPTETGQAAPHDLIHAAVETALDIPDGFWGAMARGGTFDGFEPIQPSRHRRSGTALVHSMSSSVMEAEMMVGWAYRAWRGLPLTGQGLPGGPPPLSGPELAAAVAAIDRVVEQWTSLAVGGELRWAWTVGGDS